MYVPEIRFCELGDVPALLELNAQSPYSWPASVICDDFADKNDTGVSYLGAFATTLEAPLLGYAVLGTEFKEGLLMAMFVLPEYRRLGIASQLLSAVADCAEWLGFKWLRLRVSKTNMAARALYERMTFITEKILPHYYANGDDAALMRSRLPWTFLEPGSEQEKEQEHERKR